MPFKPLGLYLCLVRCKGMTSPKAPQGFTPAKSQGLSATSSRSNPAFQGSDGVAKSPFTHYCKVTYFCRTTKKTVVTWLDLAYVRPVIGFRSMAYLSKHEDEPKNVQQFELLDEEFGSYVIPELHVPQDISKC